MLSRILRRITKIFRSTPTVIVVPAAQSIPLSVKDRMDLRDWLASPMTQLALSLVASKHPGTNVKLPSVAASPTDAYAAVSFIAKIKGWEAFQTALLTVAEPAKKPGELVESFPSTQ